MPITDRDISNKTASKRSAGGAAQAAATPSSASAGGSEFDAKIVAAAFEVAIISGDVIADDALPLKKDAPTYAPLAAQALEQIDAKLRAAR